MNTVELSKCPGCGGSLNRGLSNKAVALSFVSPETFKSFAFVGEDLNKRGLLARILPSRAKFCPSWVCRPCNLYLVDYGRVLSRQQANELAASL